LSSGGQANELFEKDTEPTARALGIKLQHIVARGGEDLDGAFRRITKERIDGFLARLGPTFTSAQHKRAAAFAGKNGLPTISTDRDWADRGGLIYYSADTNARYRRVATYVDKLLKGANPADLPVEAPTKFELVINVKTAKEIGLTIPQSVLYRADRVIK
jgi:putative ABC transport system substrate-binding protein